MPKERIDVDSTSYDDPLSALVRGNVDPSHE